MEKRDEFESQGVQALSVFSRIRIERTEQMMSKFGPSFQILFILGFGMDNDRTQCANALRQLFVHAFLMSVQCTQVSYVIFYFLYVLYKPTCQNIICGGYIHMMLSGEALYIYMSSSVSLSFLML